MKPLLLVLSGIATSALLYYMTSSMLLAQKQLIAANRLQAYLRYWGRWVIDSGFFPLFNMGREWSEEEDVLFRDRKGPEALVKLETEKKELVAKLRQQSSEIGAFNLDSNAIQNLVRGLPKDASSFYLESGKNHAQNLVLGHTFITDEEAASLGIAIIQEAIEWKMTVVDLIDKTHLLIASLLSSPETVSEKDAVETFGEMLWPCVLAARSQTKLIKYAQLFTTRTVIELTFRNIRSGSRLKKR